MRVGVVLVGLFALLVSIVGVVWFVRDRPRAIAAAEHEKQKKEAELVISKTGPWPKAVIDETDYNFERMSVGDEGSHDFVIRNEGDAPLKLKKGETTCQCTISNLERDEILPGESAAIHLTWKPISQAEEFGKGAEIHTNDPENRSIRLRILGAVVPVVITYPERIWSMDDIREDGPTEIFARLISPLKDKFAITKIENDNPHVSVETEPITDAQVLQENRGLSGYWAKVTVQPDVPVGAFNFPIRMHTDLIVPNTDEPIVVDVFVTGQRRGPIRILGQRWIESRAAITLGQFDSREGRKVVLTLIPKDEPAEGLQFTEVICKPKELRVTLDPDANVASAKSTLHRLTLTVEYPAGAPRANYPDEDAGLIEVRTNHPAAPVLNLKVLFTAY